MHLERVELLHEIGGGENRGDVPAKSLAEFVVVRRVRDANRARRATGTDVSSTTPVDVSFRMSARSARGGAYRVRDASRDVRRDALPEGRGSVRRRVQVRASRVRTRLEPQIFSRRR